MRKCVPYIALILCFVALDWGTKYIAVEVLPKFEPKEPYQFCIFGVIYNDRIQSGDVDIWIMEHVFASLGLLAMWSMNLPVIPLCMLTAGALANTIEEAVLGRATDFIGIMDFWCSPENPMYSIYNLADFMLCGSVVAMACMCTWRLWKGKMRITHVIIGARWVDFDKELAKVKKG